MFYLNIGTGGRTRTGTLLRASDFESDVSTNSTTPARLECLGLGYEIIAIHKLPQEFTLTEVLFGYKIHFLACSEYLGRKDNEDENCQKDRELHCITPK